MKKRFAEPAMHRIELNLRENIAASKDESLFIHVSGGLVTKVEGLTLTAADAMTQEELIARAPQCIFFFDVRSKSGYGGMYIPIDELHAYVRGYR